MYLSALQKSFVYIHTNMSHGSEVKGCSGFQSQHIVVSSKMHGFWIWDFGLIPNGYFAAMGSPPVSFMAAC